MPILAEIWRDQSGATAIEYGLMVAMVCISISFFMRQTGFFLNERLDNLLNDYHDINAAP